MSYTRQDIVKEDVIIGEIYVYGSAYNYLILLTGKYFCKYFIKNFENNPEFNRKGGGCGQEIYKSASPEEKEWFLKCMWENKIVPKTIQYELY